MSALDRFDPIAVSRLMDEYPDVDLEALAAEVIAASHRTHVRSREGLLFAWAKRAQKKHTHRPKTPVGSPHPSPPPSGSVSYRAGEAEEPPCSVERGRFYGALFRWLWTAPKAHTAKDCAEFMRQWQDQESFPEFAIWIARLESWPEGENFPPIPDDTELEYLAGVHGEYERQRRISRWWTPGSLPGDLKQHVEIR